MTHRKKQAAAVAFLAFVGLWVVGLLRGAPGSDSPPVLDWSSNSNDNGRARQQFANNLHQLGLGAMPLPAVLDQADIERIQVYEKIARLANSSTSFDGDQSTIRSALDSHQAVIFNETNGGIAPSRRFSLEIGVHPDKFDALVDELRQVARLESVSVQQRDRTGEFRRLHAQRQSLKKHLEAVQKLRGAMNPTIDDQLKLEQKVQDIEKELQTIGVQLGDFVGKDSYYHVYITLSEADGRFDHTYALPLRVGHAFLWALAWWCGTALTLFVLAGTVVSVRALWARPVPLRSGKSPAM
jgi:Domain of unknown function (DUF4349)